MTTLPLSMINEVSVGIGRNTASEIFSQTQAWSAALDESERNKTDITELLSDTYKQAIFIGCGSTYYLSMTAAALFQKETGIICKSMPAGELLMEPRNAYDPDGKTLLCAISRSGSTTETVKAVTHFRKERVGRVLSITNDPFSPLSKISDLALCIPEGQEKSIAQTRSFASMLIAINAVAMLAGGNNDYYEQMRKLPELGNLIINKYQNIAREFGENLQFDRFYFLGSGSRYGIACEANLKMKEMSQTHTEPFHFLEFRHGPKSMVTEQTAIIGLVSDDHFGYERKVLLDMHDLGAKIFSLAENDGVVSFESQIPERIRVVLYLPLLQIMAFYRSLAKGLNPDEPKNLTQVIYLEK